MPATWYEFVPDARWNLREVTNRLGVRRGVIAWLKSQVRHYRCRIFRRHWTTDDPRVKREWKEGHIQYFAVTSRFSREKPKAVTWVGGKMQVIE